MKLACAVLAALVLSLNSQAQILIEEKIVNGGETFIGQPHNLTDPELAGVAYFQLNFARLFGALMLCQAGVDSFLPTVGWMSGMAVAFQDCRSSGTISTTSPLIANKIRFNVGAVGSGSIIVQLFGCLAPCGFNSSGFVSLTPTSDQIITGAHALILSAPSGRPTLRLDTTGGNTNGADIDFNRLGVSEWSIFDWNGTIPVFAVSDNIAAKEMFTIYNGNIYLNGRVAAGTQANPSDNSYDLGIPITNRWRTGYFGTSIVAPVYQTTLSTPANSSATCVAGQMWADASFVYVCTSTNTIKRTALSSF